MMFPKLADRQECTACLACENACGIGAIAHYVADDGHLYVKIDEDKCIKCLKCQDICQESRNQYGCNDIGLSAIFAAWTTNDEDRTVATSGGAFAAFAKTVINAGGCVVGARLQDFECKHVMVSELSDISSLQGSKYMASSMEDAYGLISKELEGKDVLFTGLGCQCAAVLAYFSNKHTSHRLYTVDLVCGGVPSRILIDRFREQNPDVSGIVSFRTKTKYELKVLVDGGVREIKEKSLPLHGFNCGMTNRFSCYNCQFARAHRNTDITIGDLWNDRLFPQEFKNGVSMVIVHSPQGFRLLDASSMHVLPIQWRDALKYNKRTVCGRQIIYGPRKRLEDTPEMRYDEFVKLYTMSMRPTDVRLFAFRVYRFLRERIRSLKNDFEIKLILAREKLD